MADTATPRNVVEAIVAVMRDVTHVGKDSYSSQGNFNFRGIDGVVNALGPAMRQYGLVVRPFTIREYVASDVEVGQKRTRMGHARVGMTYRFSYSNADGEVTDLDVEVPGEAMDSGDKATAKAMSVAFRTCLLQSFALPTQERDPDEDVYERAPALPAAEEIEHRIAEALDSQDAVTALLAVWRHYGENILRQVEIVADGGAILPANVAIKQIGDRLRAEAKAAPAAEPNPLDGVLDTPPGPSPTNGKRVQAH